MTLTRPVRCALILSLLCSPLPLVGEGQGGRDEDEPRPIKSSPAAYGAETAAPNEAAPQEEPEEEQEPEDRMQGLLRQAETWRGLRSKQEVPSATLNEEQLAREVTTSFREDLPADLLRATESSLKAFGLVPEELDLATFLPKLLTREIAGYYDPEKNAMSLVVRDEGGVLGERAEASGFGEQQAEDMVLIHELTHALQDQHFDLEQFSRTEPLSDEATARQALVEGDATLTMLNALIGVPFEELPGAAGLLDQAMSASGDWVAGSEELDQAPPYIRETLMFSYTQGNLFCISVRQAGGQKLLDHAFRSDPPRSSEQILHPEKWHGRRDDPIEVTWPDLAASLPGFKKAAEGEMGELSIGILLREALKDQERAETAAAGWGGDRFAVYETGDGAQRRRVLAWITEWDSREDAAEFADAAQKLGAGWRIERVGKQRVVVLRGEVPAKHRERLQQSLAKAEARRPANKDIDLAVLGIRDEDRAGANPERLMERLQDPEFRDRITSLQEQFGMEKPETGTIDEDGLAYSGPTFSLRLPEGAVAAGWHLDEAPTSGVVLMATAGDASSWIGFGQQNLGGDFAMEDMLALFETGFRASIPDYKSLGGKEIESPNGKAYESQFESGGEIPLRGLVRLYQRGEILVFGAGMTSPESWKESEPMLRSILEAVALAPEKP